VLDENVEVDMMEESAGLLDELVSIVAELDVTSLLGAYEDDDCVDDVSPPVD